MDDVDKVIGVLTGQYLLKCCVCDEALPFTSQFPKPIRKCEEDLGYSPKDMEQPHWRWCHEPIAGYPDCLSKMDLDMDETKLPLHMRRRMEEQRKIHTAIDNGGAFIKPTPESLRRAKKVGKNGL